ncbi:MAG TPA: ATP-binding protein [Fibrobacteria bacterium]|nr:ATP-binding protein [Fibrobacteria bacterium]
MKAILQREKAKAPHQDFHRELLAALDEGVAALSDQGILLSANTRFAALLQIPPHLNPGAPMRPYFMPGDQEFFDALLADKGDDAYKRETRLLRPDGSVVAVFLSARRARIGRDTVICLVALDLTELRRSETVSRISEEQLRQSQKMEAVGRLASGVAHDFNNFLTAINGFSAFLLDMVEEGSPLRSGLLEISRAGERAASLTKQLLTFGRKQNPAPQAVDVNLVVSDMHRMLRRLIGEDVELILNLDPKVGSVLFNPGQMEQIILNLCLNARDAMPKGGRLVVETLNVELDETFREAEDAGAAGEAPAGGRPGRPFLMLRFTDNGTGMDPDVRDRLFEPFFTTKKSGRGTGLGLSTVYGIVKQCGGHVALESERGRGTVFRVYIPRTEEKPRSLRKIPGSQWPERYRGGETILVAEDEYPVRKLTRHLLSGNGYLVLEAADGIEALALMRAYPGSIHLLLTDVVMPNLGGRRLAEEAASLRPGIRVLYMSGYAKDTVVRCGVHEEEPGFLPKPFTPLALGQKVRECLDPARAGKGSGEGGAER